MTKSTVIAITFGAVIVEVEVAVSYSDFSFSESAKPPTLIPPLLPSYTSSQFAMEWR